MKRRRALLLTTMVVSVLCAICGVWLHDLQQQFVRNRQLIDALVRGDTKTSLALINAGADPNTRSDLPSASSLLRHLLHRSPPPVFDSPTAFLIACGDTEQGKYDEDVYREKTSQQVQLVQAMLARGADVRAQDWIGRSALLEAVSHNRLHIAELLLKRGMSANAQDGFGKTLLDGAASNKSENMVRLLLAYGADPNVQDYQGCAALHYAVAYVNGASTIQRLMEHGGDPNLPDKRGTTPLMSAQGMKHFDQVRLLTRGVK